MWLISTVAFGLLFATAVIWFGPKHVVVCTETGWPNSMFGDQFGHYDSETSTGCDVPTLGAWIVTIGAAVGLPLIACVAYWRRRSAHRSVTSID